MRKLVATVASKLTVLLFLLFCYASTSYGQEVQKLRAFQYINATWEELKTASWIDINMIILISNEKITLYAKEKLNVDIIKMNSRKEDYEKIKYEYSAIDNSGNEIEVDLTPNSAKFTPSK